MNVHYLGPAPMIVLDVVGANGRSIPTISPIVSGPLGQPLVLEHRYDERDPRAPERMMGAWWFGFTDDFATCVYAGTSVLPESRLSAVIPRILTALQEELHGR